MYKILAKNLANRLRRVLSGIIDKRQNVFLCERNLLHSMVVINEVVGETKRKRKSCILFKLDYEKTYNLVCSNFFVIHAH